MQRGFSVNKKIEVENLMEQSIIAQWVICDYVQSIGGILNVFITNELLQFASQSRNQYEQYLTEQIPKGVTREEELFWGF